MVFQEWRVGAKFTRPKKMSELNKQNPLITYIFELGLIKSVDEVKEFMKILPLMFLIAPNLKP